MAGFTNRGKKLIMQWVFNGVALPTNLFAALVTSAVAPTADTNVLSDLTEIAAGNGYTTGGISLTKNTTDFPTVTEDDALDKGTINIKNLVWTASGGPIPASGSGARYLVITDDNATVASRQVIAFFDLAADRTVSDTQALTIQNSQLQLTE